MKKLGLRTFVFEVTQRCNHDCIYCYNVWKCPGIDYPDGEMKTDEIKGLIEKIMDESSVELVSLSGGEPFLRDDIPELVGFMASHGIKCNVLTNGGAAMKKESIDNCIENGVGLFEVSLPGPDRKIHEALTRMMGGFENVVENIKKIKKGGGRVVASFVATKMNISRTRETLEFAIALDVDGIMFNRFNPGGEGAKHVDDLLPSVEEVKEALDCADELARYYGVHVSASIPIQPCLIDMKDYRKISHGFCPSGDEKRSYYAIDSVGNVRICNHTPTILGNLRKETLEDLMKKDFVADFKTAIPEYCVECEHSMVCRGGCKAAAQVCYGSLFGMEPFLKRHVF